MLGKVMILLTLVSLSVSTEALVLFPKDSNATIETHIFNQDVDWPNATSLCQFHAIDINGKNVSFEKYKGNVVIVINVASKGAFVNEHYEELQRLYEKYRERGLRILAFPSNDFFDSDPWNVTEILYDINWYGMEFDFFQKIHVTGENAHPLWKWLVKKTECTAQRSNKCGPIYYNFTKFVLDKFSCVEARFQPQDNPRSVESPVISCLKFKYHDYQY
ncbi:glutathione peroxidase-like [Venturia canescens]|uniref:glutathione peroxidase-like n=1 Tax=Venturia canescens TaxID=32260 RepID=UPI001C9C2126|nr:glutathione peroxidase-like [Venturia canescens]